MSTSILGSLAHADPNKAKQRILSALQRTSGERKKAAELLGVTHRSFYRIITRLEMWGEIDELMKRRGFQQIPGPPRADVPPPPPRRRRASRAA